MSLILGMQSAEDYFSCLAAYSWWKKLESVCLFDIAEKGECGFPLESCQPEMAGNCW